MSDNEPKNLQMFLWDYSKRDVSIGFCDWNHEWWNLRVTIAAWGPGPSLGFVWSYGFWLFFYESWWVIWSPMSGEQEMRCCGKLVELGLEIRTGNTSLKSRRLQNDAQLFSCSSLSLFLFLYFLFFFKLAALHLMLFLIPCPFFMLITFVNLPLAGRLKVIALASAVGVSAGLITLTVAIMIRWQEAHCYLVIAKWPISVLFHIILKECFFLVQVGVIIWLWFDNIGPVSSQ